MVFVLKCYPRTLNICLSNRNKLPKLFSGHGGYSKVLSIHSKYTLIEKKQTWPNSVMSGVPGDFFSVKSLFVSNYYLASFLTEQNQ